MSPKEDKKSEQEEHQEDHQPVDEQESSSSKGTAEKKKSPKMPISIGVLLFFIAEFSGFVFCLAGMTLGVADSRTDNSCYSIWGWKPKCLGSWFRHVDYDNFLDSGRQCKKADSLIQGAQAFSVMCLIGGFMTTCVALLELFHYAELAVVACIISCINMIATLVVWSTMLAYYWSNLCGVVVLADDYRIGNGLILFITAWCLQMTGNIILMVDIYLGNSK